MSPFVTTIPSHLIEKLRLDLVEQGFSFQTPPPYTLFSAKKKGISCTLFLSGKLVVQGKEMQEFVEFYLEPELLGSFPSLERKQESLFPHIGVDESGKGDFFGPLCIAAVYGDLDTIPQFSSWGLQDSKKISDTKIPLFAAKIRQVAPHALVILSPKKYNELYESFGNLNHLLAWGHGKAIAELLERTPCRDVLVDQFAKGGLVEKALSRQGHTAHIVEKTRAEIDLVVAAASILARDGFLRGLEKLREQYHFPLSKGASAQVKLDMHAFCEKWGRSSLPQVAKMHFRTSQEVRD